MTTPPPKPTNESDPWARPQEVDDATMAFPAEVAHLMPDYDDIPQEFRDRTTTWNIVQSDWFLRGLEDPKFYPKDGIDSEKALRHLSAIQGSFQPRHEHKAAAVAYLLSRWFDKVTYKPGDPAWIHELRLRGQGQ